MSFYSAMCDQWTAVTVDWVSVDMAGGFLVAPQKNGAPANTEQDAFAAQDDFTQLWPHRQMMMMKAWLAIPLPPLNVLVV